MLESPTFSSSKFINLKFFSIKGNFFTKFTIDSFELFSFFFMVSGISNFFISTISLLSNLIYNCSINSPLKFKCEIFTPPLKRTKIVESRTKSVIEIYRVAVVIAEMIFIILLTFLYDLTRATHFDKEIFIKQGSIRQIIANLPNENINKTPIDPYILARLGTPKQGFLNLEKSNLPKIDFFYKLTTAKPVMEDIVLIPGDTTVLFLSNLAKKYDVSLQDIELDYNKSAPFYEGFLVPQTFSVAKGSRYQESIKHLINYSFAFHKKTYVKLIGGEFSWDRWKEVLIKASIIQKEAAGVDEMRVVSSVIDNRLKRGMRLQMDGSLNYGIYSNQKITPERIRNDSSSYNTYLNYGLPKEVVCVVSKEAIIAAIEPIESDFLYFMRDKKSGKHIFTKSYNEHLKTIKKGRER